MKEAKHIRSHHQQGQITGSSVGKVSCCLSFLGIILVCLGNATGCGTSATVRVGSGFRVVSIADFGGSSNGSLTFFACSIKIN